MRWIFGLGGLLITAAVIVVILGQDNGPLGYTQQVVSQGEKARVQARAMSGQDAQGRRVSQSLQLKMHQPGGRLEGIDVVSIAPGSAAGERWGLVAGDRIIQIGPLPVRNHPFVTDASSAADALDDAYARQQTLILRRADQRLEVP